MVTKKKSSKSSKADNQLAAAVRESAQQIWLAGLGAFAKAQEEGNKVFEALVREGRDIQGRTRSVTEEKLGEVTGRFGKVAGGLSKQATASWDRLEQVFEERVARALSRLGVPTQAEVQALIERVDALNASVQALGGKPTRSRQRASAAAPKVAAKRAAAGIAATPSRAPRKSPASRATGRSAAAKAPATTAPVAPVPRKTRAPRKAAAPAPVTAVLDSTGNDNA